MAAAASEALRNADMRTWARDNGWEVADLGRLPAGVIAAYEAAHPGEDDSEGGPDWQAAAQALGVQPGSDPLASDDETEDMPGQADQSAQPSQPGQQAAAPPVANLADARARAAAQPRRPAWAVPPGGRARGGGGQQQAKGKGATARGKAAPKPEIEVTPAVRADMQGKLALLLAIPGSAWQAVDGTCGGAFNASLPDITAKLVPVLCQSQAVVRLLTLDDTWFALVGLAVACKPVALAVYQHHFSEQAQKDKAARRRGEQPAQGGQGQGEDLSAYAVQPTVTGHVPAYQPA